MAADQYRCNSVPLQNGYPGIFKIQETGNHEAIQVYKHIPQRL